MPRSGRAEQGKGARESVGDGEGPRAAHETPKEASGESGKGAIMTDRNCYRDITVGEIGERHIGQEIGRASCRERV